MILRLRSRDGLERVEVPDAATVGQLKQAIHERLSIPLNDLHLSKNPGLLTSKNPMEYADMSNPSAFLKAVNVSHGDMIFMLYSGERNVEPGYKRSILETRPFGSKVTVDDISAKQVRIERQEKAEVGSISFDRQAANQFQAYVRDALAFSIQRGGLLYGTVDEDHNVKVEFIYEPPQEGKPLSLNLHRHTPEESQVDLIAEKLGLRKVGWVLSQSTAEREFIMNTREVMQTAAMQAEIGETCTTVIVTLDEEAGDQPGGHVHFEAFQCSKQCVKLVKDGWLVGPEDGEAPTGVTRMRNPADPKAKDPVMVAGKDVGEVDNDYFLCPVKIADHDGPLLTSFPIENRLFPQGKAELRDHLRRHGSKPYVERISDFHLLLWLSKQGNLDPADMTLLLDAVRQRSPVLEGYRVIIDSIAGL